MRRVDEAGLAERRERATMSRRPLAPARITLDADGIANAIEFGDRYHPRIGAAAQAEHVFLAGNRLPARWAGASDFTVLETGFGLGNNFLATWNAWRTDPHRGDRLHYVSIEAHPLTLADLQACHRDSAWPHLARALTAAWPPLAAGLHAIDFDAGRVRLLLAFGDVRDALRDLDLEVDAVYLDGFAPDRNPDMWQRPVLRTLAQKARPGATAATWSVAREVHEGLRSAGFEVERVPGIGGKREVTRAALSSRFSPRRARRPGAFDGVAGAQPATGRQVVIVGAGLAGAWSAYMLARDGWTVTVLDRQAHPAQESSSNPAGIFHGTVHADDGPHARFNRAAALTTARLLGPWLAEGMVPGAIDGLLRLAATGESIGSMAARRAAAGLHDDYVRILDPAQASAACGLRLDRPAWAFVHGGWTVPGALVRHLLTTPGIDFQGGANVETLRRDGARWTLCDPSGRTLAETPTVVLANAAEALRLWPGTGWPVGQSRGQISWWPSLPAGAPRPRLPLAGDGYALSMPDGALLCGATAAADDTDPTLREQDHGFNLERLGRLTGCRIAADAPWQGRVGWRTQATDRMPIVGPMPGTCPERGHRPPLRLDDVAREPGLFVMTALGSRGLTWGPLAAMALASWMGGTPMPLEARLRNAIDPGRWRVRAARRER